MTSVLSIEESLVFPVTLGQDGNEIRWTSPVGPCLLSRRNLSLSRPKFRKETMNDQDTRVHKEVKLWVKYQEFRSLLVQLKK